MNPQTGAVDAFDMRGAVGQQWTAAKSRDGTLSSDYAAVGRSYSAQRAFRQKWAKDRFDEMKDEREKSQEQLVSYGKYGHFVYCYC